MRSWQPGGRAVPTDGAGRFLFYGLLPAWGIPGVLDWWQHRRSHIEEPENGGVRESLLHLVMLGEGALPLGLTMFAEINPLELALLSGSALVHEATAHWDLTVATESNRIVSPTEQQVHGLLETAPFLLVLLTGLHAWPGLCSMQKGNRAVLRRKRAPLPRTYVAGLLLLTGLSGLPHIEELWRCSRNQRAHTRHR